VAVPVLAVTAAVKVTGCAAGTGSADVVRLVVVLVGAWTLAGAVIVSESRVTAAVRASARPSRVTPVVTVIEAMAMTFPCRTE
jgi:hypothetical protein